MGAMPGAPGQEQLPAAPGAEQQPGMEQVPPADGQQGGMAPEATIEPIPEGQLSERQSGIQTKILNQALDVWDLKAEQSADRWTEILDASLDRLFERQQRVILEKALGAKSRKAIKDQTLSIDAIFDVDVWNRQMEDDLRPLLKAVAIDAATLVSENVGEQQPVSEKELDEFLDAQVQRVQQANETTKEELAAALLVVMALSGSDDEKASMLRAALIAIFANLLSKRKRTIAEHESQTAFNAGTYLGSLSAGLPRKKWLTRRDIRVREAHKFLDGKSVEIDKGFAVDGSVLRFPGDPLAPPSLTINCRCRLRFDL
jgi:hypothetical protein